LNCFSKRRGFKTYLAIVLFEFCLRYEPFEFLVRALRCWNSNLNSTETTCRGLHHYQWSICKGRWLWIQKIHFGTAVLLNALTKRPKSLSPPRRGQDLFFQCAPFLHAVVQWNEDGVLLIPTPPEVVYWTKLDDIYVTTLCPSKTVLSLVWRESQFTRESRSHDLKFWVRIIRQKHFYKLCRFY